MGGWRCAGRIRRWIFSPADDDADGWGFSRQTSLSFQRFEIKLHLAFVFGLEVANLELDGDQVAVKQQQVDGSIAAGEFGLQVTRQGFDNGFAPALFFLLLMDGLADFPIKANQLAIYRPQRLGFALASAGLELGQKFRVAGVIRYGQRHSQIVPTGLGGGSS